MTHIETRNLSRDSLFMFGDLALQGGGPAVRVKIRNLSPGGMMAEGGFAAVTGQLVTVTLRTVGEVQGRIAWVQGNRFGVSFSHQIAADKVRTPLFSGEAEAPRYARPALSSNQLSDEPRQLRPI